MKILILGVTGMLGHILYYYFNENKQYDVFGTVRCDYNLEKYFNKTLLYRLITDVNACEKKSFENVIKQIKPDLVINCIGIIKQLKASYDSILSISINALFPHQLAEICSNHNCRLIHISTDCVFSGLRGRYAEDDFPDADDLYGRTKYLGEVDSNNVVTLRTSIIGHELGTKISLIDWFLSQEEKVKGFSSVIYTGFPTVELASIINKYIIPDSKISGLYQVSSSPISKFDLLKLVAKIYGKEIEIIPDDSVKIDRSLKSDKFRKITGYTPPTWEELIYHMHEDYESRKDLYVIKELPHRSQQ